MEVSAMSTLRNINLLLAGFVAISFVMSACVATNQTDRSNPVSQVSKQIGQSPPIVTLQTKPAWLLLGGVDPSDPRGGDIIVIEGKSLQALGWAFTFENDNPDENPLVVTLLSGNRVVYWKGKGTIINKATREKVELPLPQSIDPRTDTEREAYFEERKK